MTLLVRYATDAVSVSVHMVFFGYGLLASIFLRVKVVHIHQGDLLSVLHALVDLHLKYLPPAIELPAVSLFAAELGVDVFALALTF